MGGAGRSVTRPARPSLQRHDTRISADSQALEKYNIEKDIAAYIKKEFDRKYNPTWHCIVGRNFGECAGLASGCDVAERPVAPFAAVLTHVPCHAGSYVTHETKNFIYFYLGKTRRPRALPARPPRSLATSL